MTRRKGRRRNGHRTNTDVVEGVTNASSLFVPTEKNFERWSSLDRKVDENFLVNNVTFGSGNMNLKDTYGEPEISKAYTLAKQIRVGTVPKSPKRQMLYFVRDMVHFYRSNGFHLLANSMAKDIQFFDVNEIFEYVSLNLENIFPEQDTPPSTDVVLPAHKVGLYCNLLEQDGWVADGKKFDRSETEDYWQKKNPEKKGAEAMYILSNLVDDPEDERYCRIFEVDIIYRPVSTDTIADAKPLEVGEVDTIKGTITPYNDTLEKHKPLMIQMAQFACAFLQTINTPRFVVQRQRKFIHFTRQR